MIEFTAVWILTNRIDNNETIKEREGNQYRKPPRYRFYMETIQQTSTLYPRHQIQYRRFWTNIQGYQLFGLR